MNKVSVIFGTRPEAIKLAPVLLELQKYSSIKTHVCVTGQHRELLDQVLHIFDILPHVDLDLMRPGQSLSEFASRALIALDSYLAEYRPNFVLVQGDTTSTFVASLAAFYNKIIIGHVEAGLRSFHKYAPFPEEINRLLTSHMADYHFAPTETSKANLQKEGIRADRILVTGNTGIDALFFALDKIKKDELEESLLDQLSTQIPSIRSILRDNVSRLVLVTGHRRENFGKGFDQICLALKDIAELEGVQIVYPVHLNPNVQEPVSRFLKNHQKIHLIEPLDYFPFVYLMAKSYLILTDSGGIQEEAPSLGKPVLVMRHVTERAEVVHSGAAKVVGSDRMAIVAETQRLLDNPQAYKSMSNTPNPYGDGQASKRIVSHLLSAMEGPGEDYSRISGNHQPPVHPSL